MKDKQPNQREFSQMMLAAIHRLEDRIDNFSYQRKGILPFKVDSRNILQLALSVLSLAIAYKVIVW